jgi:glycosyltransferase involved in cell wall biosynthesis
MRMRGLLDPLVDSGAFEIHILAAKYNRHGKCMYAGEVPDQEMFAGYHIHRSGNFSSLPWIGRRLVKEGRFDIVHSHNMGMAFCADLMRRRGIPHVMEIHTIYVPNLWQAPLYRWTCRRGTRVITLSQTASEWLTQHHFVPANRLVLIRNGYDENRFPALSAPTPGESSAGLGTPRIAYVGSFHPFQGVMLFVEMVQRLVEQGFRGEFIMVGAGPQLDEVRNRIAASHLTPHLQLRGWIPYDEVVPFLRTLDALVIPRPRMLETDTAFPLKALEAMAAGCPILGTRVRGLQEILTHGETAWLTEPDAGALAAGLRDLLSHRSAVAAAVDRARRTAETMTWSRQSARLCQLYQSLAPGNSQPS